MPTADVDPAAVAVTSALPVGVSSPNEDVRPTPDNPFAVLSMKSQLPQEDAQWFLHLYSILLVIDCLQ